MPQKLSEDQIKAGLEQLKHWKRDGNALVREWTLKDFIQALKFVNEVGEIAQRADHHPDILIHGWNKVKLMLSTHTAGGITTNDVELAGEINALPYETR